MSNLRKNLSNILTSRFLYFLLLAGAILLLPSPAKAKVEKVVTDTIGLITGIIANLFISLLGTLFTWLVTILVSVAQFNHFIDLEMVQTGWSLARDVANMFFIVVLLVIAFSTILKIQSYHYQRTLVKLIIMAVLINFSKLIAGFLIDFFQVIMLTFVNGFKDVAAGNFADSFQIYRMLSLAQGDQGFFGKSDTAAVAAVLAVIMLVVADMVLLIIIAVLLYRIAMLWVLVILSPLAYLAYTILPQYWSMWWQQFFQHLTSGPVIAFFLWLALLTSQKGELEEKLKIEAKNAAGKGKTVNDTFLGVNINSTALLNYMAMIALLLGGLAIAQKMAQQSGSVVGSFAQKVQKYGTRAAMIGTGAAALLATARGAREYIAKPTYHKIKRGILDYSTGRIGEGEGEPGVARRALKYIFKEAREGWKRRGEVLMAESTGEAAAAAIQEANQFFTGGFKRVLMPWKNLQKYERDAEGRIKFYVTRQGKALLDNSKHDFVKDATAKFDTSYSLKLGSGYYLKDENGKLKLDENGIPISISAKEAAELDPSKYLKLDEDKWLHQLDEKLRPDNFRRFSEKDWNKMDEYEKEKLYKMGYRQVNEYVRDEKGIIRFMSELDKGKDQEIKDGFAELRSYSGFIEDKAGNKVRIEELSEGYRSAIKESEERGEKIIVKYKKPDASGKFKVEEYDWAEIENNEELKSDLEKREKDDEVEIIWGAKLIRDKKGRTVLAENEEEFNELKKEGKISTDKSFDDLQQMDINDWERTEENELVEDFEARKKYEQLTSFEERRKFLKERARNVAIWGVIPRIDRTSKFGNLLTPELELARSQNVAKYIKEYMGLGKDRFMEQAARVSELKGAEGYRRREAILMAAAAKGYLDDLMSHPKFRFDYAKLAKKYGWDDGTFYNEMLLNEFLYDFIEGTKPGEGKKKASQLTHALIDELEDLGRNTRHFEYMGQTTFDPVAGKYRHNKIQAVTDKEGWAVDHKGNRIKFIGKDVDLTWDENKKAWVDIKGNIRLTSEDLKKGIRLYMPEQVEFAIGEWNKLGGRAKIQMAPHMLFSLKDKDGEVEIGGAFTEFQRRVAADIHGDALRDIHHAQARLKEWMFKYGVDEQNRLIIKDQDYKRTLDLLLDVNPDFVLKMYGQLIADPSVSKIKFIDYSTSEWGEEGTVRVSDSTKKDDYYHRRQVSLNNFSQEMRQKKIDNSFSKKVEAEKENRRKLKVKPIDSKKIPGELYKYLEEDPRLLTDIQIMKDIMSQGPLGNLTTPEQLDRYYKLRRMLDYVLDRLNKIKEITGIDVSPLIDGFSSVIKGFPPLDRNRPLDPTTIGEVINRTKADQKLHLLLNRLSNILFSKPKKENNKSSSGKSSSSKKNKSKK